MIVFAGKLAAEVVVERSAGIPHSVAEKAIVPAILEKAQRAIPKDPVGVKGEGAIAFGGGAVVGNQSMDWLKDLV